MTHHLTRLAFEWAKRCFGDEHVMDREVRALRIAEEVVELCQAEGIPPEKLFNLISAVYHRPSGSPYKEIGQILMTTAIYCEARGWEMDGRLLEELGRCLAKSPESFAQRNQEKLDLGLSGSTGR